MRLGLLLCDHVRPELEDIAGDYPEFFRRFFSGYPNIEMEVFDLAGGHFPEELDQADAWITSGSRLSVYDDIEWVNRLAELVQQLDRERRKLIGVCFGAQMIAHALGGVVARAPQGWQVGLKEVTLVSNEPWMAPTTDIFRIIHSNADQILRPPERLRVLGSSDQVPVSVIAVGDHFIGFQGHPEFLPPYSSALMEARRGTVLSEEVVDAGLLSLAIDPDTKLLSSWIASFIGG